MKNFMCTPIYWIVIGCLIMVPVAACNGIANKNLIIMELVLVPHCYLIIRVEGEGAVKSNFGVSKSQQNYRTSV